MSAGPYSAIHTLEGAARRKLTLSTPALLSRAAVAGMFVALSAFCGFAVSTLFADPATGKLVGSLLFPMGLGVILLTGGELFTGNSLLVLPLWEGQIKLGAMLRCWALVYLGNLLGSLLIALLTTLAKQGDGAFLALTLYKAASKAALSFPTGLWLGILCNILVAAAVFASYGTDSAGGKMAAMYLPVAAFVLCDTEHSIANMYYFAAALMAGGEIPLLHILRNMAAATLGNILGGSAVFAGAIYVGICRGRGSQEKA